MKLSIVATLYKSESYIEEFCQRAALVAQQLVGDEFEIILVDDGSPDSSLSIALSQQDIYPNLSVVELSRNFGHHKAMLTGLSYADGERIFLIDSDLEEEPEWLLDFSNELETNNFDVVYGVQESRKGNLRERVTGKLFYKLFNLFANIEHPHNITTARLMTKDYVRSLLLFEEREVVFSCLCELAGFSQSSYIVKKHSTSPTTYSTTKKIRLLFDNLISFSSLPLEFIFYFGMLIFFASIGVSGYLLVMKLFYQQSLDGWTSIVLSIWLLGGLTFSFMGIIGMYISKIFNEIKRRPLTIVKKIHFNK
ncbi:glycosyltransferase family 2 protein [Vibrio coralliilyticus]|uniref:Glycosyl transferase n=1 Tax=Vibrio coralliilyticus TaxID=190893 RepID=A0AAN0VYD8_9VIBR|nr:glycosyltransferase family 2 protein [Vibrio coralliilyticus]AIW20302.1 glycosyl transferase [Vibrio coralliilyticus]NOH38570.1 glycosyltransferase family 2 protein [Vibrio coralliilyticus]